MRPGSFLSSLAVAAFIGFAIAASAQQVPANWNSSTAYTGGGLVRGSDGNYYRCLKNNTGHAPTTDAHQYWELYYVRTSATLKVSRAANARFTSLKPAWAMCSSATISPDASVQVLINAYPTPYTETFTSPFSLNAVSGERITLTCDSPKTVILTFTGGDNGFVLNGGHKLGAFQNIGLDGSSTASTAVLVDGGSELLSGLNVTATNFANGFEVDHHSGMAMTISNAINPSNIGFLADHDSHLDCTYASVTNSAQEKFGVVALNGSEVDAQHGYVVSASLTGFYSDFHGTIYADQSNAGSCFDGYDANHWSLITATNSTATANTNFGFNAILGGHIDARGASYGMNAVNFGVPPNTSATDQSYIAN